MLVVFINESNYFTPHESSKYQPQIYSNWQYLSYICREKACLIMTWMFMDLHSFVSFVAFSAMLADLWYVFVFILMFSSIFSSFFYEYVKHTMLYKSKEIIRRSSIVFLFSNVAFKSTHSILLSHLLRRCFFVFRDSQSNTTKNLHCYRS